MNRENTIGMFISTSLMSAILGAISGLVWAFALSYPLKSGLFYGCISGLIVGFLFFLFQKAAISSGNLQNKEVSFASNSMITLIFMISTVIAIVTGLVSWLFF
jgi:hypothetical protein